MKLEVGIIVVFFIGLLVYLIVKSKNQKEKYIKQEAILENKELVKVWFNRMSKKYQGEELDKKFRTYMKRTKKELYMQGILLQYYDTLKKTQPIKFEEPVKLLDLSK